MQRSADAGRITVHNNCIIGKENHFYLHVYTLRQAEYCIICIYYTIAQFYIAGSFSAKGLPAKNPLKTYYDTHLSVKIQASNLENNCFLLLLHPFQTFFQCR